MGVEESYVAGLGKSTRVEFDVHGEKQRSR
jgi:hypothetical protein